MLRHLFRPRKPRQATPLRPMLEALEERTVPDATQVIQLPPGQNIFQVATQVIQTLEAERQLIHAQVQAVQQQETADVLSLARDYAAAKQDADQQVVQAEAKLAQDQATGTPDILDRVRAQAAQQTAAQVDADATAENLQLLRQFQADVQQNQQLQNAADQVINDAENQIVNLQNFPIRIGQPGQINLPPGTGSTAGGTTGGTAGGTTGGGFFNTQTLTGQFNGTVVDNGANTEDRSSAGQATLDGQATIVLQSNGDFFNPQTTVSGMLTLTQTPSAALRSSGAIGNGIADSYGGQYSITGTVTNGTMNLVLSGGDSGITLVAQGSVNAGKWQFQQIANNADFGGGQYSFS